MKKILTIMLVITTLGMQSCDTFLEEDPKGLITPDNFYNNPTDAVTAVNAVYIAALRSEVLGVEPFFLNELAADDTFYTGTATAERDGMNLLTWDDKSSLFQNTWANRYRAITRANEVLIYVNSSNAGALSKRVRAEACFMRAFCYFDLVRWYGDVPLVTGLATADLYPSRSPRAAVYNQIIEDLKIAENDLDDKYSYMDANGGRATKGAAKSLLGKVYLTMAGAPMNMTEMYAEAEKKLKEVIDNSATYGYKFMPVYSDMFPRSPNDGNKALNTETIFYTRCNSTLSAVGGSWSFSRMGLWTRSQGFMPSSDAIASSDNTPNALYNKVDLRRKSNLGTTQGAYPTTAASPFIVYDLNDPYSTPTGRTKFIVKYLDFVNGTNGANDFVWLRYSDVLLMYAEALIEQGKNLDVAKGYINMTRNRAGIGNTTAITQVELREELRKERHRELFFEGQRRFDLVRWNIYAQAVKGAKERSYFFYKKLNIGDNSYMEGDYLKLFPIPKNELITNPNIKDHQNPGY
ncbi:RagB/SusD family nutrient uptake outer membrane protein [Flavobacterium sp. FlaQc-48]|uniref:RagB/SusD family nutrient uptake outer membrane protein n=1 Tax=Flavobacterium sp. FlaQc-48 TaxID=3374181 RepID=UPI0037580418